jgi:glycosyltransferase involved in cell wall biosynthesis
VHNAYQQKGGEDSVVESEIALLQANGHAVEKFARHNDEADAMGRIPLALRTIWNAGASRAFAEVLESFRPDVVHVHNTYLMISPSIYWTAARFRVPVVQTLHNFRLLCPQAMFLRDNKICEDCLGHVPWRSVVHACYRNSKPQSAVLATAVTLHRAIGTYHTKVSRYIALNEFCRQKFVKGGLPAERIVIKANFVEDPIPVESVRSGFLFVGRLSSDKGVEVLAQAARESPESSIRVAGTGPQAAMLHGLPGVQMLGALSGSAVREEMQRACALLLPSIWYENLPRTLVEAFACGLPVIGSRLGALKELIVDGETGLLFDPGSSADLAAKISWAQRNPGSLCDMGVAARAEYEKKYTPEKNYVQLLEIYRDAIDSLARGGSTPA